MRHTFQIEQYSYIFTKETLQKEVTKCRSTFFRRLE